VVVAQLNGEINLVSSDRKVLFSHPGCPPFAQQAARALYEADLLSAYATTFSYKASTILGRALSMGFGVANAESKRQLLRRQITEVPERFVITHPVGELVRTATEKTPVGPIASDLVWEKAELWFDRVVARKDLNGERAVYAYEHAALDTFRAQSARGGLCIYEMPTSHHKKTAEILKPEFEGAPKLETRYERHLKKHASRRNDRKNEELELADIVIVNSSFTRNSMIEAGVNAERIFIVPLGAPPVTTTPRISNSNSFVFLSAGKQSIRKGSHYMLQAWSQIAAQKGVELWMIGPQQLPTELLANLPGRVTIRPSVSRQELFEIFLRANMLVFPSLVEGFGMVINEAMAHGLPVITTPNTAGPELIEHGKNGFIVPIRDADKLAETMEWCLKHPIEVQEMGRHARSAAAKWQWGDYRLSLSKTVSTFLTDNASR
jgi:glycosyltransferase involved in cell wall biosynthesis